MRFVPIIYTVRCSRSTIPPSNGDIVAVAGLRENYTVLAKDMFPTRNETVVLPAGSHSAILIPLRHLREYESGQLETPPACG